MTDREKEAFIGGIEFARDWNLDIPPDDLRLYERLIQERTKKENEQSHIDGIHEHSGRHRRRFAFYVSEKEGCDNMGILKGIIDRFRAMGKSEKEISGIIETAADKATVNPDVTKPEKPREPEIKIETTAEAFVEAVLRIGATLQQAKTAILKMSSLRDAENRKNTNNWRKMHGLPMRRKQKARKKHERGKGADCH